MGEECNTCKPGSFNLNAKDNTGCTKCWCNGVSDECQSSNWRRSFISSISSGGYNSSDGVSISTCQSLNFFFISNDSISFLFL